MPTSRGGTPPARDKIITKLMERRQIEAYLQQMRLAASDQELRRQAETVAALGPQVVPAIIGNLDRADEKLMVAMGLVSSLVDRPRMVDALRRAVLRPDQTDHGRVVAMTILERFLGQPPDDDLLTSVRDPEGAAISALQTALEQSQERHALLADYVEGLDRQEPDVVLAVVRALREGTVGAPEAAVESLRLMAQDVREEIGAAALDALGSIRLPEAARALQTLWPVLAPGLAQTAERVLRKLQFAGIEVHSLPQPDAAWRAMASPVDGYGRQSVWFVQQEQATGHARFLNVLLNDRAGAVEAAAHGQVPLHLLPPRRPKGSLHDIPLPDGSGALLMLEISFDVGRRLIRDALAQNRETQIPLPGMLRLLGPWLWGVAGAGDLPPRRLPPLPQSQSEPARGEALLQHPAFATWTLRSESLLRTVDRLLRHGSHGLGASLSRLAGELVDEGTAQILRRRLLAMSEWLWLAGETELAQQAMVTAEGMAMSPQALPFVHALIRRDVELFSQTLREQTEMVRDNEKHLGGL
jgi:hypothetical protein